MKLVNSFLAVSLLVVCILSLVGCGKESSMNGSEKIYYLNYHDGDVFTDSIKDTFKKKAESSGIKVDFLDAKGDINLQVDQLRGIIAEKPGAIVLLPVDGVAIAPVVQEANEMKIPVIVLNRSVEGGKAISVTSDNKEAGRMQGEYMAKILPQNAKIVYFIGQNGNTASDDRWLGFKETCLDKRPDVQVLASAIADFNRTEGFKTMTIWLKLFPQINGVVAANDEMALGAIQALKDANRLNGCIVSGVDANADALNAIKNGEMSQTVKQDGVGQAEGALKLIDMYMKGQNPTENMIIPFSSITKENLPQT
jgi:ABC-type sugar transport system, periplasmic component